MILHWFLKVEPYSLFYLTLQLALWIPSMLASVIGFAISIYMQILNDDYRNETIEPVELSDKLARYIPLEYLASLVLFLFSSNASE